MHFSFTPFCPSDFTCPVTLDFNNLMSENDQEINIKSAILIVVTTHIVVLVSGKDRKEQIVFEHLVLYSFVEKMLSMLFFSFNQNFSVIFSTCHTLSSPYLQSIPRLGVWCPFVKIPQLFLSGRLPRLNSPQHPSHVLQWWALWGWKEPWCHFQPIIIILHHFSPPRLRVA